MNSAHLHLISQRLLPWPLVPETPEYTVIKIALRFHPRSNLVTAHLRHCHSSFLIVSNMGTRGIFYYLVGSSWRFMDDNTWQHQVAACHLFIVVVDAALVAAAAVCSISADEDIGRRAILFCEYLRIVYVHICAPVSSGFKCTQTVCNNYH